MENHEDFGTLSEIFYEGIEDLSINGGMPLRIAQKLIRESLSWDHPSGSFVEEPRFAEKIGKGRFGWELAFGGNTFLVELAAKRCAKEMKHIFEDDIEYGYGPSKEELEEKLISCIRSAVANHDGSLYKGNYYKDEELLRFGVHVINCQDFARAVVRISNIQPFLS